MILITKIIKKFIEMKALRIIVFIINFLLINLILILNKNLYIETK